MKNLIKSALDQSTKILNMPLVEYSLQIPKNKDHGDIATNIAFVLSKHIKDNPLNIANTLKKELEKSNLFSKINIANPGFINFHLNPKIFIEEIKEILNKKNEYGRNESGKSKKVLLEFVSANPTGPLTIGHGRGAILGDCLSNILSANGFEVTKEYYYNNAGRQMRKLADSVFARYMENNKKEYMFPEDGYKGEYIKEIASQIKNTKGPDLQIDDIDFFKDYAENYIFTEIKNTLKNLGITFDSYFNENTLYENKDIYKVIDLLKEKDLIYKKENAIWFSGTKVGRDSDRVLIKSSGEPTYRLPDMAYHITKYKRDYDVIIDIFGADHMDAYPDIMEVLNQLGYDINKMKVLIHQFVSILEDGSAVKMSTRKANFITLNQLISDVGKDAVRYFFIMRSINSHLNFDLKIAKEKSEKNPVFYIQYAHARICTILNEKVSKIHLNNLEPLIKDEDLKLIYKLLDYKNIILKLKDNLEPQLLSNYLYELSTQFHKYYSKNRIISENQELSNARVVLIKATKTVIKNGLDILGISAPESM